MQKVFYLNPTDDIIIKMQDLNQFLSVSGCVISVTPNYVHGAKDSERVKGGWLVVAENGQKTKDIPDNHL